MKSCYLLFWLTIFSSFNRLSIQKYDNVLKISDAQICLISRGDSRIQLEIQCTKDKNQFQHYSGQFTKQYLAKCSSQCSVTQIKSYDDFYMIASRSIERMRTHERNNLNKISINQKEENIEFVLTFTNQTDYCRQNCVLDLLIEKGSPIKQNLDDCQIRLQKCRQKKHDSEAEACIQIIQSCQQAKRKVNLKEKALEQCQKQLSNKQTHINKCKYNAKPRGVQRRLQEQQRLVQTLKQQMINADSNLQAQQMQLKNQSIIIKNNEEKIRQLQIRNKQLQYATLKCQVAETQLKQCQDTLITIVNSVDKGKRLIQTKQQAWQLAISRESKNKTQKQLTQRSETIKYLFWFDASQEHSEAYSIVKDEKYIGSAIQRISKDNVQYNCQSDRKIPFGNYVFSLLVEGSKNMHISIGLGNQKHRNLTRCSCQDTLYYNLDQGTVHINGQNIKTTSSRKIKIGQTFSVVTDLKANEQETSWVQFYIENEQISKHIIPNNLVKAVPYALIKTFDVGDTLVMSHPKLNF